MDTITDQPRPSVDIKAELEQCVARVAELDRIIEQGKEAAKEREVYESTNIFSKKDGRIQRLRELLDEAVLRESDESRVPVVWLAGYFSAPCNHIVDKITAKRIFTRSKGYTRCDQFNLDGTPVAWGPSIDIKATFGVAFVNAEWWKQRNPIVV